MKDKLNMTEYELFIKAYQAATSGCIQSQYNEAQQYFSVVKSAYENEFVYQYSFNSNEVSVVLMMQCLVNSTEDATYKVVHFYAKDGSMFYDLKEQVKVFEYLGEYLSPNESDVAAIVALQVFKFLVD